jgi:hypothetical protein
MATTAKPPPEVTLASLAILKVNWDTHQRDYIGNFVPFLAECLKEMPQDEVSLEELRDLVFAAFGLAIPHGPLRTILARAQKEGLVRVDHGIYRREGEALRRASITPTRDRVIRAQAQLVAKLREFCAARHDIEWNDEQAEQALLSYVSDFAGPILVATVGDQPLPVETQGAPVEAYLVNSFIIHIHETEPERFDELESVVKGSMLANALYYPDLGAISQHMSGVEVFFDTRIVLEALLGNSYQQRARKELFELVYDLGGQPKIFDDTEREIRAVLENAARSLHRGTTEDRQFGLLTQHLVDSGFQASDVELIIARLPKVLGSLKITIRSRPRPIRSLTVDEAKLEQLLKEGGFYARREPLHHDINVITAIHRLRNGVRHVKLETCKAVFVTTNYPMISADRQFFKDEYDLRGVPRCYADSTFETLVWLKKPLRAPDLPRRRILADCIAALRPSEELWTLYAREIERLQQDSRFSSEDFALLRNSLEAKVELMEVTLGDSSAFGEGTVQEVLRRSRAVIQGEAVAEIEALRTQLEKVSAKETQQRAVIATRAERTAFWVTRGLFYASVALLIFFVYLTLPSSFNGISSHLGDLIAPLIFIALIAVAILTILSLSIGASLDSLLRQFETWLKRKLEEIQLRIAGGERD